MRELVRSEEAALPRRVWALLFQFERHHEGYHLGLWHFAGLEQVARREVIEVEADVVRPVERLGHQLLSAPPGHEAAGDDVGAPVRLAVERAERQGREPVRETQDFCPILGSVPARRRAMLLLCRM